MERATTIAGQIGAIGVGRQPESLTGRIPPWDAALKIAVAWFTSSNMGIFNMSRRPFWRYTPDATRIRRDSAGIWLSGDSRFQIMPGKSPEHHRHVDFDGSGHRAARYPGRNTDRPFTAEPAPSLLERSPAAQRALPPNGSSSNAYSWNRDSFGTFG